MPFVGVRQWAAGAGAINLLTDTATSSDIPDDVRADRDSAVLDGGNDGWSGTDEKQHARRHLVEHLHYAEQAASYVMAQGISDRGAKRLSEPLRKAARR